MYVKLNDTSFKEMFGDAIVELKVDSNGMRKVIRYEETKYPFMLHAEQNAILTASDRLRLKNATIYITHFPCHVCLVSFPEFLIGRRVHPFLNHNLGRLVYLA